MKHKNIKLIAFVESITNVLTGLLLSIFIIQPIVFSSFGITLSNTENILIAIIFTIVSIIRGYIWRLFFHKHFYK